MKHIQTLPSIPHVGTSTDKGLVPNLLSGGLLLLHMGVEPTQTKKTLVIEESLTQSYPTHTP